MMKSDGESTLITLWDFLSHQNANLLKCDVDALLTFTEPRASKPVQPITYYGIAASN